MAFFVFPPVNAYNSTNLTMTFDPTKLTAISINSEVGLTVTLVEDETFSATVRCARM